jgi:hypothetical protein
VHVKTADIADIVDRYTAGATVPEIAKHYGYSWEQVNRIVTKAGVVRPRPPLKSAPVKFHGQCRDCGESLDRPHIMGTHLPECSFSSASLGG